MTVVRSVKPLTNDIPPENTSKLLKDEIILYSLESLWMHFLAMHIESRTESEYFAALITVVRAGRPNMNMHVLFEAFIVAETLAAHRTFELFFEFWIVDAFVRHQTVFVRHTFTTNIARLWSTVSFQMAANRKTIFIPAKMNGDMQISYGSLCLSYYSFDNNVHAHHFLQMSHWNFPVLSWSIRM